MDRFTIKSFRNSVNGKAYTVILGSAWTDKNGRLQLAFDALPLPDDKGAVRAFLEPREATGEKTGDDAQRERSNRERLEAAYKQDARGASSPRTRDMDDDVPF
jgi:hypothetical protein